MLLEYLRAAMGSASITPGVHGLIYRGSIPGLAGVEPVWAGTEQACRDKLRLSLVRWLTREVSRDNPPPALDGIVVAFPDLESKQALLGRLNREGRALEKLLESHRGPFEASARAGAAFAVKNWSVVVTLVGVAAAVFFYQYFGVNSYLESVLTLYNNKQTAKKYSLMGDRMMEAGEWNAAKDAFDTALKLDPNNTDAISATYIVSLYRPPSGQSEAPDVIDTKLNAIHATVEGDEYLKKYMYLIEYFEGVRSMQKGDNGSAEKSLRRSLAANPRFIEGYIGLAEALVKSEKGIDEPILLFEHALPLYRGSPKLGNNLGLWYLYKEKFQEGRELLHQAVYASDYLESMMNYGDALLFTGDPAQAAEWHEAALAWVADENNRRTKYFSAALFNFYPTPDDPQAPRRYVRLRQPDEFKMYLKFALCLDHALDDAKESVGESEEACKSALGLAATAAGPNKAPEPGKDFRGFFANKITFVLKTLKPAGPTLARLEGYRKRLSGEERSKP